MILNYIYCECRKIKIKYSVIYFINFHNLIDPSINHILNSELLLFSPRKIIIPHLILNQSMNKQIVPFYTYAKHWENDLLQKRPADDGAGAVTAVGVLPGQWGESQSQQGHADVLAKDKHKSQCKGLKLWLCCPLVVKRCRPRVPTDTLPARLARWRTGQAGPSALHPSCLPLSKSIFGKKRKKNRD